MSPNVTLMWPMTLPCMQTFNKVEIHRILDCGWIPGPSLQHQNRPHISRNSNASQPNQPKHNDLLNCVEVGDLLSEYNWNEVNVTLFCWFTEKCLAGRWELEEMLWSSARVQEKQHKTHSQVTYLEKISAKLQIWNRPSWLRKSEMLSVASHTVVCEFAWTRRDLFPGYYLFHAVCYGCR